MRWDGGSLLAVFIAYMLMGVCVGIASVFAFFRAGILRFLRVRQAVPLRMRFYFTPFFSRRQLQGNYSLEKTEYRGDPDRRHVCGRDRRGLRRGDFKGDRSPLRNPLASRRGSSPI